MTDTLTQPLWEQNRRGPKLPALRDDVEADVVIIGAGITGLTAALRLAENGKSVVVLEAREVASGVTGWTSGHLTEAIDARYAQVVKVFGREGARLVAASSRAAIEHVALRVDRLRLACDFARVPGFLFSESSLDRDGLAEELEAARNAGLSVRLDTPTGLDLDVSTSLRFDGQARFDATAYTLGLMHAATARGVRVYEHSRVVEFDDGEPVTVTVENGQTVRAAAAFCATHVPLNRVLIHTKLRHLQSYVAAFDEVPIPDALYWDTAEPYHYLRVANVGGRRSFVVGGFDHATGAELEHAPFEKLEQYVHLNFATRRVQHQWSAQVVESLDGLPYLGRNSASTNVFVATGFGGNGLTFGTVGALLVTDLILKRPSPWSELFDATRIPLSAATSFVRDTASVPVRLIGDRLKPADVRSTWEIGVGQGKTMDHDGKRLAVFRDQKGGLHAVSAACTHLGCLVHFNENEKTWDCPCHGSRFGTDGQVMDGPALRALERTSLADDPPSPHLIPDAKPSHPNR